MEAREKTATASDETILVVDDFEDGRLMLGGLLRAAGYPNVIYASSAEEVMRQFAMDSPHPAPHGIDLVLLDISMPHVDGIELCRRIKARPALADVPIIMVTAHTDEEVVARAFEAGAIDYISKPIRVVELLARVRSALRLKCEMDSRRDRERDLLEMTRWLEEANASLQRLTTLDPLTGVSNRRRFDALLASEWRRSTRAREPLSIVMIDIDHFKAYNDHFGHPAGDACLRRVAVALRRMVQRSSDELCRYGGEEFAAVLPKTDEQGAMRVGESLRRAVVALRLPSPPTVETPHVTISVGVASGIPPRLATASLLLEAADAALYQAKQAGRNRVATQRMPAHASASSRSIPLTIAEPPRRRERVPKEFWTNRARDVSVLERSIARGDLTAARRLGQSLQAVGLGYEMRELAMLGERLCEAADEGETSAIRACAAALSALVRDARRTASPFKEVGG